MKSGTLSIHCGNAYDSFDYLKKACETEAEKLCESLCLEKGEVVDIPFWTNGIPELICIGKFSKSNNGSIVFELDFSESTL